VKVLYIIVQEQMDQDNRQNLIKRFLVFSQLFIKNKEIIKDLSKAKQ
jgi:hypothetical protein